MEMSADNVLTRDGIARREYGVRWARCAIMLHKYPAEDTSQMLDGQRLAQLKTVPRRTSMSEGLTTMSSCLLSWTRRPLRLNRLKLMNRGFSLNFGMVGTTSCAHARSGAYRALHLERGMTRQHDYVDD